MPFCEGTLYHRLGETQPDYLAAAVGVCVWMHSSRSAIRGRQVGGVCNRLRRDRPTQASGDARGGRPRILLVIRSQLLGPRAPSTAAEWRGRRWRRHAFEKGGRWVRKKRASKAGRREWLLVAVPIVEGCGVVVVVVVGRGGCGVGIVVFCDGLFPPGIVRRAPCVVQFRRGRGRRRGRAPCVVQAVAGAVLDVRLLRDRRGVDKARCALRPRRAGYVSVARRLGLRHRGVRHRQAHCGGDVARLVDGVDDGGVDAHTRTLVGVGLRGGRGVGIIVFCDGLFPPGIVRRVLCVGQLRRGRRRGRGRRRARRSEQRVEPECAERAE